MTRLPAWLLMEKSLPQPRKSGLREKNTTTGFHNMQLPIAWKKPASGVHDLDHVAFYDRPWLKFERLLETYLTFAPRGLRSYLMAMPLWLKEKLWMGDQILCSFSKKEHLDSMKGLLRFEDCLSRNMFTQKRCEHGSSPVRK